MIINTNYVFIFVIIIEILNIFEPDHKDNKYFILIQYLNIIYDVYNCPKNVQFIKK